MNAHKVTVRELGLYPPKKIMPTSTGIQTLLVQCSCSLSLLGLSLVMISWGIKDNRKKHGRILLFWFFASSVYLIQTLYPPHGIYCNVIAVLGILFPVASFIWTDFVAYYMFLVLRTRNIPSTTRSGHAYVLQKLSIAIDDDFLL